MDKIQVGDVYQTKEGGYIKVIRRDTSKNILVEHMDDHRHRVTATSQSIINGSIRNPYHRSVCSVGYRGIGPHKRSINGRHTRASYCWKNMLYRVYCEQNYAKHPTYSECSVDETWHNFQNFAEWFYQQPNSESDGYQLDKDLMYLGNKTYSPDTCCFVPGEINKLLCDRRNARGVFPQGVSQRGYCYLAKINIEGESNVIGVFDTPEEAYEAYKKEKDKYVKYMADKYKNQINRKVYENLKNWRTV